MVRDPVALPSSKAAWLLRGLLFGFFAFNFMMILQYIINIVAILPRSLISCLAIGQSKGTR